MLPPWAMITPSAPDSGTSISAVTAWDLFLMLTTQFSDRRPMPPKRSWVLPLISTGRPAMSGFIRFARSVVERQHVVARRLDQPQALQLVELLRHLLGQVVRLAPVLVGVVELPDVVVEGGHLLADEQPGRLVPRHRGPALVVDAAVAEHLEVLRLVPLGRLGVVERVQHADALDGLLLHAVHRDRLGESRRLEDRRRDVDDVVELRAHLALRLDPLRPVHDRAVARAAPVRRDLLGPLVGRVHGVRPAHRVVVVGLRPAELVEPGHEEFRRLEGGHAVEVDHLVERAVQRALGRRAVVADDVVDERVVEDVELLQPVEQAADVVVGVLQEAGVDFHLPAQHRLERLRHVVPRRDLLVTRGELAVRRNDAQASSAAQRSLRAACPSPGRTCPCTCPPIPSARGAARGWPRARSRRRTACRARAPSAAPIQAIALSVMSSMKW